MKKRLFSILFLVFVMMLGLIACGKQVNKNQGEEVEESTVNNEEVVEEELSSSNEPAGNNNLPSEGLIALSHKSLDYYAFVAMQEAAKHKTEEYGWDFESAVADNDSAQQMNQFINFISKEPLAIISDPIDSEGLVTAIDNAVDAGIPVGIFDTPTTSGDVA